MSTKGNYGIDSPAIVATLGILGLAGLGSCYFIASAWRWVAFALGAYFLLGAVGMLFYSKVGKLSLRERLLDRIPWRGDEKVLDVGCGRGLLLIGAAKRLKSGKATGVDTWQSEDLSGNNPEATLS